MPDQLGAAFRPSEGPGRACLSCRGAPGILAMNAYTRVASGPGTPPYVALQRRPSRLVPTELGWLGAEAARWKAERYDWGLLKGLLEGAE